MHTKFQQCMLIIYVNYFITVDAVTRPKIIAELCCTIDYKSSQLMLGYVGKRLLHNQLTKCYGTIKQVSQLS